MVLRAGEEQVAAAIDECVDRALLADEEFLDDHASTRVAELPRVHDLVDRERGFHGVARDDDALAEREAVRLHHERIRHALREGVRLGAIGKAARARGRDAVALHEFLREDLRGFELRGVLRRAEDAQARGLEAIDDAGGERVVGTDDGEVDALVARELHEGVVVGDLDGNAGGELRDAGVARRAEDGGDARRLAELPH